MQLSIKLASALVLLGKMRVLSAEETCACVRKSCAEPWPALGAAAHLGAGRSRPVRLLDLVLVPCCRGCVLKTSAFHAAPCVSSCCADTLFDV